MHALVGVDADRSDTGETERSAWEHPEIDEIPSQAFAQPELDRFRQPALEDVEHEQRTCDDPEHPELHEKLRKIAPRQRVVERLVPAVEPDLPVGRRDDDQQDHTSEPQQRVAHWRSPERFEHHAELRHEARTGDVVAVGIAWLLRVVAHRSPRFGTSFATG